VSPNLRAARPGEERRLQDIERAADRLFEEAGVSIGDGTPTSREELEEARVAGALWVATDANDHPVGYALLEEMDGAGYLAELAVHPDHGRRGLGSALVRGAERWAAERGHDCLQLSTFRDVPWNGPFYARLGFREIPEASLGPELRRARAEEARRGLDPTLRCCMRKRLDGNPIP
jgi:GNAT superfamily N-acetyltransferase